MQHRKTTYTKHPEGCWGMIRKLLCSQITQIKQRDILYVKNYQKLLCSQIKQKIVRAKRDKKLNKGIFIGQKLSKIIRKLLGSQIKQIKQIIFSFGLK